MNPTKCLSSFTLASQNILPLKPDLHRPRPLRRDDRASLQREKIPCCIQTYVLHILYIDCIASTDYMVIV